MKKPLQDGRQNLMTALNRGLGRLSADPPPSPPVQARVQPVAPVAVVQTSRTAVPEPATLPSHEPETEPEAMRVLRATGVRFANDRTMRRAIEGLLDRLAPACADFEDPAATADLYASALVGQLGRTAIERPYDDKAFIAHGEFMLAVDMFADLDGAVPFHDLLAFARRAAERRAEEGDMRRLVRDGRPEDAHALLHLFDHDAVNGQLVREIANNNLLRSLGLDGLLALIERWVARRRPGSLKQFMVKEATETAQTPPEPAMDATADGDDEGAAQNVKNYHLQLLVPPLPDARVDREAVQAILAYGFLRPGTSNSGYRTGTPVMRSYVWRLCHRKVKPNMSTETFDRAVDWLIGAGVLEWFGNHETIRIQMKGKRTNEGAQVHACFMKLVNGLLNAR